MAKRSSNSWRWIPNCGLAFGAIRGDIEGDFQPTPCTDDSGRDSKEGPNYVYFDERWGIFDLGEDGIPDAVEACGPTLIEGDEAGIGFIGGSNPAFAIGKVTGDPTFPGVTEGSRMYWRGTVTDDPDTGAPLSFEARLRIWPRH